MLTIHKTIRFLLALIFVIGLTNAIDAQSASLRKEKKEKVTRSKRTKTPKSNSLVKASSSLDNDDLRRFLVNFQNAYKEARDLANDYRLARVLMEDKVRDLEAVEPVNEPKIDGIKAKIKTLKKQEKVALSNLKKYKKYASSLTDIKEFRLSKQQKLIASVEAGYQKMPRVFAPPTVSPLNTNERPIVQEQKPNQARATKKTKSTRTNTTPVSTSGYAVYDRSKDVIYNPPTKECGEGFRGMDEFLGKEKIELAHKQFFFHTDPELRQYMKGEEYINCTAGMATSTGGLTTLNIEVTIRSQNAQREFGGLQKGNPMTIKLINGEIVKLLSVNSDNGTYDQTTGLTTFRNQFLVQKGEEKSFLESEIDKVRLVWSNGYEDYDVYEVDFMMNQINCLYSN